MAGEEMVDRARDIASKDDATKTAHLWGWAVLIRYLSLDAARSAHDGDDLDGRVLLAVAGLPAVALSAAELEDMDFFALDQTLNNLAGDLGTGDEGGADLGDGLAIIAADEQDFVKRDGTAGGEFATGQQIGVDDVACFDATLAAAFLNDRVHSDAPNKQSSTRGGW